MSSLSLSDSLQKNNLLSVSVFQSLSLWVSVQHSRVSQCSSFLSITHSLTDIYIRPSLRNILEIPPSLIPQHMLPLYMYSMLWIRSVYFIIYDELFWPLRTRVDCSVLCTTLLDIGTPRASLRYFIPNYLYSEVKNTPGVDNLCEMTVFCTLKYSWDAPFRPSYHILLFICTFPYSTQPMQHFLL